mmetsp:Transcript_71734/g.130883  ORF Transcript_71734/g.130883 Transcript_71734/m.130883 type:complete len:84 (+) Transcript_71734:931-1182(+)
MVEQPTLSIKDNNRQFSAHDCCACHCSLNQCALASHNTAGENMWLLVQSSCGAAAAKPGHQEETQHNSDKKLALMYTSTSWQS